MVNLLGDLWRFNPPAGAAEPGPTQLVGLDAIFSHPRARLHLYGKAEPRPGRKMGHLTVVGPDLDTARRDAVALRAGLRA